MSEIVKRKSGYDTGAASEFLVLSILYRLGIEAFISLGNKKAIDIIIKAKNGQSITVDVKSVRDYSSIVVNNVIAKPGHFIVGVVYKKKFQDPTIQPDFYIIPSDKVIKHRTDFNGQLRLMTGRLEVYRNKWDYLKL